jgi:uncharacterized RDD family membrane protein YckC
MKSGPGGYAGIVSRGAAFAFDGGVALLVCTVGFQFAIAILAVVGVTTFSEDEGWKALGYVLVLPVVFGLYCAGFWVLVGRTPGMMLLGIRVVTADGGRPGVRRSVIRAFGYWISAIALVGFAWIAVDERSQGFHDKLAGTYVVYDSVDGGGHPGASHRAHRSLA